MIVRALVEAIGPELKRLGILDDGGPWLFKWLGRLYAVVVFALVFWLTPSARSADIFGPLLALAFAWLLAVPLTVSRLSADDEALLARGLKRPGIALVKALERMGLLKWDEISRGHSDAAGDSAARYGAATYSAVVVHFLSSHAIRAVYLGALAFAGLLYGPTLATMHVLGRGLDTVLIALAMPLALRLLAILIAPVMLNLHVAALRADELADKLAGELADVKPSTESPAAPWDLPPELPPDAAATESSADQDVASTTLDSTGIAGRETFDGIDRACSSEEQGDE